MDESEETREEIVHLSRLALAGRPQDVQLYIRRLAKRYRELAPELSTRLTTLLEELPSRVSPLRSKAMAAVPVDLDSRLQLVRYEAAPYLDVEPIYPEATREALGQVVAERRNRERLDSAGLAPTRTVLFTGPPGVGKSLAARWLARELDLPLLVLDLAAVMSSFLGRTGTNVRRILDYAKGADCVLLVDELDALAKRRDDATEIGELKRLVTVLLQEIDDWPVGALLIAATNHAGLLDPAVWRRFEMKVEFPMPDEEMACEAVHQFLGPDAETAGDWPELLAYVLKGASYSDMELVLRQARKAAVLSGAGLDAQLERLVRDRAMSVPHADRIELASHLVGSGLTTQRRARELTGVSRDAIRKRAGSSERTSTRAGDRAWKHAPTSS
jgi:SpoVK/Ycf46/Vps4 family AAA+-type ATPase